MAIALGGRIAALDSEHGSVEKYSDLFDFDLLHLANHNPAIFPRLIGEVGPGVFRTDH